MTHWRSQPYLREGRNNGVDSIILKNAVETAEIVLRHGNMPPILTLRHLCHLSGASFPFLRHVIGRASSKENYRTFAIRKKGRRTKRDRRLICVPEPRLLNIQRWIALHVLSTVKPHPASRAFAPTCTLVDAAIPHCGARWLVKLDVKRFFESISEFSVYRVFIDLGYQPLVAFELTRLCTRARLFPYSDGTDRWRAFPRGNTPSAYNTTVVGYLPQGAPTSPMLANLAVRRLDESLESVAAKSNLTYTRYADDLTFSSRSDSFSKSQAGELITNVYSILHKFDFSPNTTKTSVNPPGSRKIVLGLLVNGHAPRLTRQFRYRMRQHLHYLSHVNYGPAAHAKARNFQSVEGLRKHLYGLVAFAGQVDSIYGDKCREELESINWQA